MLTDMLPFSIHLDPAAIAGAALWALALYLGLSPVANWLITQLNRWFNFAERSLYISQQEFERTRKARESQNAFYASLFSIIPFGICGILLHWGLEVGMGQSWSISVGIIACMGSAVYELGRRSSQVSD
ncbi:MAG: hypothetical protein AAF215_16925 [Cyanobacteria bacterium P01_A01_bin.123]